MEALKQYIRQMIDISEQDLSQLLSTATTRQYKRLQLLSSPGTVPNEIFFVIEGIVRVVITDNEGEEHTVHFAIENQFIADYSGYILMQPAMYSLQAVQHTAAIVLPRAAIDWGYAHLPHGQKLGRLVAEYYFIYQDHRIKNIYARTPAERYNSITDVFPNIHNRVPQHMIASYLGITPVHLSRLKKAALRQT
jgi:CRP-like cAMP-binding protein